MGNTVLWKPSPTQAVAAYLTMQLLEAAGLPAGVINLVLGDGPMVSEVALADPRLAGIHFTGSTATFQRLWREVGDNIANYHGYPRLVGETGGKDFVVAHSSADPDVLTTALIRGAFDYQGQKCSAASRAFVPKSVWATMGDDFIDKVNGPDLRRRHRPVQLRRRGHRPARLRPQRRRRSSGPRRPAASTIAAGGTYDDSEGFFVQPDRAARHRPDRRGVHHRVLRPDPVGARLRRLDARTPSPTSAPLVDTGLRLRADRRGHRHRPGRRAAGQHALRFAAGNFYVNDKPTGAVVGQQPFGGARASGTNDKAGSPQNLLRWTSARTIKETFVPPRHHPYPHQAPETGSTTEEQLMSRRLALSNPLRPALLAAGPLAAAGAHGQPARSDPQAGQPLRARARPSRRVVVRPSRACWRPAASSRSTTSARTPPTPAQAEATVRGLPVPAAGVRRVWPLRTAGELAPLEVSIKLSALGQSLPDIGRERRA